MVRRPKFLAPTREEQRWLVSYTDVLTLLLILFIAVAAQTVGQSGAKVESTGSASAARSAPTIAPTTSAQATAAPLPNAAAPVPAPSPSPSHEALHHAEELLKARGLDAKQEARGLVISLPQAVLFGSGDDHINASARPIIAEIVNAVGDLDNKIELAGHADSIPIHTRRFKNNWELSSARGLSLLSALTKDYGIAESRLTVASYGSFSPKTSNDTPDGRAENRRVEILILDQP